MIKCDVEEIDWRMPAVKTNYFAFSVSSVHLVEADIVSYFSHFFFLFVSSRSPENPTIWLSHGPDNNPRGILQVK